MQAKTSARVAYSAVALTIVGYPLLDKIEAMRLAPPPKPKSGGVTAELEAAAAAGAAAAAAALKGVPLVFLSLHHPVNQQSCPFVPKACSCSSAHQDHDVKMHTYSCANVYQAEAR